MFTGIIEETGVVEAFSKKTNTAEISIKCDKTLEGTKIGDSISVNGVCQTVTEISANVFKSKISAETLSITTIDNIKKGDRVNLERALMLNTRLGGHIVSGHVDCTGKLVHIEQFDEFYNMKFEVPKENTKYIVRKGSITVNGISLTVAKIYNNIFEIAVIPHTYTNTNLQDLKIGDFVNIETDILAKYVEKILLAKDNNNEGKIDIQFLQQNGFV